MSWRKTPRLKLPNRLMPPEDFFSEKAHNQNLKAPANFLLTRARQ
jgi:hypothetical protein